jgi:hypothetical protein
MRYASVLVTRNSPPVMRKFKPSAYQRLQGCCRTLTTHTDGNVRSTANSNNNNNNSKQSKPPKPAKSTFANIVEHYRTTHDKHTQQLLEAQFLTHTNTHNTGHGASTHTNTDTQVFATMIVSALENNDFKSLKLILEEAVKDPTHTENVVMINRLLHDFVCGHKPAMSAHTTHQHSRQVDVLSLLVQMLTNIQYAATVKHTQTHTPTHTALISQTNARMILDKFIDCEHWSGAATTLRYILHTHTNAHTNTQLTPRHVNVCVHNLLKTPYDVGVALDLLTLIVRLRRLDLLADLNLSRVCMNSVL